MTSGFMFRDGIVNIGQPVYWNSKKVRFLSVVNTVQGKYSIEIDLLDGTSKFVAPEEILSIAPQEQDSGQSKRYNSGKVQTREIDPAFILGIGEVLTKSRQKYDHFNWAKPTQLSTPYESMMRHILAFQSGENFDKETQSHHLLHAATNLMFMYYHITNNPEESDDRFFKKDKKDV